MRTADDLHETICIGVYSQPLMVVEMHCVTVDLHMLEMKK